LGLACARHVKKIGLNWEELPRRMAFIRGQKSAFEVV